VFLGGGGARTCASASVAWEVGWWGTNERVVVVHCWLVRSLSESRNFQVQRAPSSSCFVREKCSFLRLSRRSQVFCGVVAFPSLRRSLFVAGELPVGKRIFSCGEFCCATLFFMLRICRACAVRTPLLCTEPPLLSARFCVHSSVRLLVVGVGCVLSVLPQPTQSIHTHSLVPTFEIDLSNHGRL
jgi:hypothetical protein